ncbi:MAG: hypothetical protein EOO45_09580 [Flavobacterium sp.]|nr:MAG: hypothetical protein EOO45_09580 [Flavobacterium sp.]
MKKFLYSGFLACALVFVGCSSDDDNNNNNNNQTACETAETATQTAKTAYESATDQNFTAACNSYKAALVSQMTECGDTNGSIQSRINALGDCAIPADAVSGTVSVTAGSMNIVFDDLRVVRTGDLVKVTGETSGSSAYTVSFEIMVNELGSNKIMNFKIFLTSQFSAVPESFTSAVAVNDNDKLESTFSGRVRNSDNGQIELTSGVVNITY